MMLWESARRVMLEILYGATQTSSNISNLLWRASISRSQTSRSPNQGQNLYVLFLYGFLHRLTSSMVFWIYPCYFKIRLDAPGITYHEVFYTFLHDEKSHRDKMVVHWKRPTPHQSRDPCQLIDEDIQYGAYCRIISFPEAIRINLVGIILKHGILHIIVPKYPYILALPEHSCHQCLRCIFMK